MTAVAALPHRPVRVETVVFSTLALVALVAIVWVAWPERTGWDRTLVLLGSFFFASWILTPLVIDDGAPGTRDALAFVTCYWRPTGHDLCARLEARMDAGTATDAELERLRDAYEEEGRTPDARRIERRRLAGSASAP